MTQGSELDEIVQRTSGVIATLIGASTKVAEALIELRIRMLRESARQDREQTRIVQSQTRAYHQADAGVWKAAMRPQWWRAAGAEDISRVWRAASTWAHVDPRAAEARRIVVDRLAERGVHVDPDAQATPSPEDVAWLSDALDRAAAEQAGTVHDTDEPGPQRAARRDGPTVIDGEVVEPAAGAAEAPQSGLSAQEREERAAGHVRVAWPAERAERVQQCKAWGALVHQLDQLEDAGHDVEGLLRGVPGFVDRAHTPAAFAYRSIQDRLDGMVDLGTQGTPPAARGDRDPGARAEAAADADRGAGDHTGAGGQAAAGDGQAAQAAAQAYPIPTRDAVVDASTEPGTGPAAAGSPVAPGRPGVQQHRDDERGR